MTHRYGQAKEPILQHEFTARSWAKVAGDLCELDNRVLLVVSDYYGNYIEVVRLSSLTTRAVVKELAEVIFTRFGVPNTLVTDNGPQYSSAEFAVFAKTWMFEHKTSSLAYTQSNGKAENTVHTVENLFKKSKASGTSELQAFWTGATRPQLELEPVLPNV